MNWVMRPLGSIMTTLSVRRTGQVQVEDPRAGCMW